MPLAEIIKSKEDELRNIKDHEVAAVYDADGNLVIEIQGGTSSVDLGPYIAEIRNVGQATLVHNHPLGWQYPPSDPRHAGNSFSPEDIGTACFAELTEIRAVGPRWTYSLHPALGSNWVGDSWLDTIQASQEEHTAAVKRSTLKLVREGRISQETAEANFWHEVWLRVAGETAVVYQRFENE